MHVALVISQLSGGGAARVLSLLANHLLARGHEISVVTFEASGTAPFYPLDAKARLVPLDLMGQSAGLAGKMLANLRRMTRLRGALRALRPDVAVSFVDITNVLTILALMRTGIPVLACERSHPLFHDIGRVWSGLRRACYPLAALVTVQTREARDALTRWGLTNTAVIANPVPEPARELVPLERRPLGVLAAGRLSWEKNYPLLIEAFAEAADGHPEWTLEIAGDGPEKPRLESLARQAGISHQMKFLGHVRDMEALYQSCSLFAMSSLYEGFPNALCEAMAHGLPCVSTNCPSGPGNIITDGHDGLLVETGDARGFARALRTLMDSAEQRQRLGDNASRITQRLGAPIILGLWEQAIHKAASKEKP